MSYTLTRSQPPGWTGHSRRIDAALLQELVWPAAGDPLAFSCGPTRFVRGRRGGAGGSRLPARAGEDRAIRRDGRMTDDISTQADDRGPLGRREPRGTRSWLQHGITGTSGLSADRWHPTGWTLRCGAIDALAGALPGPCGAGGPESRRPSRCSGRCTRLARPRGSNGCGFVIRPAARGLARPVRRVRRVRRSGGRRREAAGFEGRRAAPVRV